MRIINTDPYRWIGFTNDPAETVKPCGWIRVGHWTLYAWPFGARLDRGKS